jgi:hypothetical protein
MRATGLHRAAPFAASTSLRPSRFRPRGHPLTADALRAQHGGMDIKPTGKPRAIPTPAQIAERSAEIRANWTDKDFQNKAVLGMRRVDFELPSFENLSTADL